MNNRDPIDKLILKDEHFDFDWERQRVKISNRIHAQERDRRTIWKWAAVTMTFAVLFAVIWIGTHQIINQDHQEIQLALLEEQVDEIIDGRLPGALMVLNGWIDVEETQWDSIPDPYDPFDQMEVNGS